MPDLAQRISNREKIAKAPRVFFVCGRDWMVGPDWWQFGFAWDRNLDAEPGEMIYRKRLILCWRFSVRLDRRLNRGR